MKGFKFVCLAMSAVFAAGAFAACNNDPKEPEVADGKADSVNFDPAGQYTATVRTTDVTFPENLAESNIAVAYGYIDEDAYSAAVEAGDENAKTEDYMKAKQAKVDSFVRNDAHTLTVTFTDSETTALLPDNYSITVGNIDGNSNKYVLADVNVNYPELTLTPTNVRSVSQFASDIRLTFELGGGKFAGNVTKDDLTLYGSFADLEIASVSSSQTTLTMQLTGTMAKNAYSNTYLDGSVEVAPKAIQYCKKPVTAIVPIDVAAVYTDPAHLTFDAGTQTLSIPVKLGGYRFAQSVADTNFVFERTGAEPEINVTGFTKTNDSEGVLSLKVDGVSDQNGAIAP